MEFIASLELLNEFSFQFSLVHEHILGPTKTCQNAEMFLLHTVVMKEDQTLSQIIYNIHFHI